MGSVDRTNLYLLNKETDSLERAYAWNGPKAPPLTELIESVPLSGLPWFREQFYEGNPFVLNSLTDLPAVAQAERALLSKLE